MKPITCPPEHGKRSSVTSAPPVQLSRRGRRAGHHSPADDRRPAGAAVGKTEPSRPAPASLGIILHPTESDPRRLNLIAPPLLWVTALRYSIFWPLPITTTPPCETTNRSRSGPVSTPIRAPSVIRTSLSTMALRTTAHRPTSTP